MATVLRRGTVGLALTVVPFVVLSGCGGGAGTPSASRGSTTQASVAQDLAGVPPCVSSQLQATAEADEPISAATVVIHLSNTGSGKCFLQGYLGLSLPDQGAHLLHLEVLHKGTVARHGFQNSPAASHPQAVVLRPAQPDAAWIATQWHNWCGSSDAINLDLKLILRNGGQVAIAQPGPLQGLKCTNPNAQSIVEQGPVQTPAG
jgi:hypothetical protein